MKWLRAVLRMFRLVLHPGWRLPSAAWQVDHEPRRRILRACMRHRRQDQLRGRGMLQ